MTEEEKIDGLRKACGTLPNRAIGLRSDIFYGCERLRIDLVDQPVNAYKSIFAIATATWGDDQYKLKWSRVMPGERFKVVLSALRGQTLPTALEAPKYTFQVRGVPRHCFDQMARTRIGAGFGSIGCRDNSKNDSSFILYSAYQDMPPNLRGQVVEALLEAKQMYASVIAQGKESYQVARSLLPMSYHHPFVFTQSLLSLISQARRRMCFGEEEFICGIHWLIRQQFLKAGFFLLGDAMRPACDSAHECVYAKADGSELFGNLFSSCFRWPSDSTYSEFNKSCTSAEQLQNDLGFPISKPDEFMDFSRCTYRDIGPGDRRLFESD